MKTILVITDFSMTSRNAAIYGTGLARTSEAKLLLYYLPGNFSENEHDLHPNLKEEIIQKKLMIEADQLSRLSHIQVTLLQQSNSIEDIIHLEKDGDIDLVIIGIKSLEPLSDLIFKDEMRDLIRKTHVPVIIIPEERSFKKIKKIAFAIDFKLEEALSMHPSIKALLDLSSPELIVLNVVKENTDGSPHKKVSENNIEGYFGNRPHVYSFIENNDVVKGLEEFITINNIDMITMLPHKHHLLGKLLAESKTRKMAFHTTVPLLLLPEG